MTKATTTRAAGSLERGLDVLELLAECGPLSLAQVHERLAVSRATAFRILAQLQSRGYVEHDRAARRYGLGAKAASLGTRSKASVLVRVAEPMLTRLHDATRETVNLAVFQGGRVVYVRIIEAAHALRMSGTVGEEAPLHATALGKAILSTLPESAHAALVGSPPYPKLTKHTVSTAAELRKAVAEARERGYAIDHEEVDEGAICLGAAIRGPAGEPVGGLSVSAVAARMPTAAVDGVGELIASAAKDVGDAYAEATAGRHAGVTAP